MSRRDAWNKRYATRELLWSAGPNQRLAERLADLPPGTALDVACGEGRNALWLAERGWNVTAIDFSEVAIEKAREIGERRGVVVNWLVADVGAWKPPADGFDLIVVLYLHTDPDERARWLPNVVQAVNPGGTFFYLGHDPSNIEHGVGGPQREELLPGVDAVVEALPGFEPLAAEVVRRTVDAEPGHGHNLEGIALDTLVQAVRRPSV